MTPNLGWLLAMPVFLVALEGAIFYFLPNWTRRDLYFAVTVDPAFRRTEEGQSILSRYRRQVMVHVLIALALVALWRGHVLLWQVGVLWIIGGATVAFLRARRDVIPHAAKPSTVREASLTPIHEGLPGGWIVQVLPFAILVAVALHLHAHWSQIPLRFPIHWDFEGNANGWSTRTPGGVYMLLVIAAETCGLTLLIALLILHASPRVHASGVMAGNEGRFRRAVLWVLLGTEFLVSLTFAWASLLPLRARPMAGPVASTFFIVIATLAFVAGTTPVLAHVGQGGTKRGTGTGQEPQESPSPVGDGTDDRFWKAGMFYCNRNDPALFVEKRFGIGYDFNYGHPVAWVILGAILALPFLIILIVKTFGH